MAKKTGNSKDGFKRDDEKELERRREARIQSALERLGSKNPRCALCSEDDPRVLEKHHVAGRAYDPDSIIIVCRNHHRKLSDSQKDHPEKRMEVTDPLEVIARFLVSFADILEFVIDKLREFAKELIERANDPHTHQEPTK